MGNLPNVITVVGLGAGGHAKVVIEILCTGHDVKVMGLLDPKRELWGSKVLGVPVLGDDDVLVELHEKGVRHAFVGLGGIGDTGPRTALYAKARSQGFEIVAAVHPQAVVSPSAEVGHGPTIMAAAVVNAGARLGDDVIVNTSAVVEHDCVLADHVHVATGALLASAVHVGEGAHVGVGASVRQGIRIGERAIVGAGAVVVADVPDDVVVVGVPARVLRKVKA